MTHPHNFTPSARHAAVEAGGVGRFCGGNGLTGWGLLGMDISATYKAFLGVSWLYLITTAFTLAKMLRDRHEADLADGGMAARLPARRAEALAKDVADRTAG